MAMTRFEKAMAIVTVLALRLVESDFREDDPAMPPEIADWADPKLWRASCIAKNERRM